MCAIFMSLEYLLTDRVVVPHLSEHYMQYPSQLNGEIRPDMTPPHRTRHDPRDI